LPRRPLATSRDQPTAMHHCCFACLLLQAAAASAASKLGYRLRTYGVWFSKASKSAGRKEEMLTNEPCGFPVTINSQACSNY